MAVFAGPERGNQVWRSTGLTDRDAALAQARTWEAEARIQRQALGKQPRRAAVRVRRSSAESGGFGPLTQREVAALMKLSERAVRNIEKRALGKLKNHPALGMLLGILPIPIPGLGTLSLGLAGGPLVVGLLLGRLGRTGGWVWTMPFSANVILRNLGLTLFLAQVGMSSGPKFLATVQQTGPLFLGLGAAIVLVAVLINLLVGHFIFRFRLDDLLGATCGVAANPAHAVFASKLVPSDRTDIAYAITYPTGTIMKILLLQVMLAMMGKP
jgi:AspT/YidE/YbjL antiporter-like protein